MMTWFKLHHEIIHDPKIRMMSESDQLYWFLCLCLASASSERGTIALSDEEIAFELRTTLENWKHAKDKFRAKGLIEMSGNGRIVIARWEERQYQKPSDRPEAVRERQRKHREKKKAEKNVTPNVTLVTPESRGEHADDTRSGAGIDRESDPVSDRESDQFYPKETSSLESLEHLQNIDSSDFVGQDVTPVTPDKRPCHAIDTDTDKDTDPELKSENARAGKTAASIAEIPEPDPNPIAEPLTDNPRTPPEIDRPPVGKRSPNEEFPVLNTEPVREDICSAPTVEIARRQTIADPYFGKGANPRDRQRAIAQRNAVSPEFASEPDPVAAEDKFFNLAIHYTRLTNKKLQPGQAESIVRAALKRSREGGMEAGDRYLFALWRSGELEKYGELQHDPSIARAVETTERLNQIYKSLLGASC